MPSKILQAYIVTSQWPFYGTTTAASLSLRCLGFCWGGGGRMDKRISQKLEGVRESEEREDEGGRTEEGSWVGGLKLSLPP